MRAGLAAALAVAAAVLLGWAPAAAVPPVAHARLYGASPAPGALLPQAPAAVELTFTRVIAPPASVAVTSPSGRRVGTGDPAVLGRVVTARVAAREPGTYTVGYRAVTVDGHPITGRYTFSVGHRSAAYAATSRDAGARAAWVLPAAGGGVVLVGLLAVLATRIRRRDRSAYPTTDG